MHKYKFILIILIALFTFSACAEQTCPEMNGQAPAFSLNTLDGKTAKLEDYLGKTVILNFWQTTCTYCKLQMPLLQNISDKYSQDNLVVLAVNVRESTERVKGYIDNAGYSFTVLLDKDAKINQKYCVPAFPANIFIDKQGLIRNAKLGAFQDTAEIEDYLKSFN
jgi:peroxiredoxin